MSQLAEMGVAVTVALTPPAVAVAETACHSVGANQSHVGMATSWKPVSTGDVCGSGTRTGRLARAAMAMIPGSGGGGGAGAGVVGRAGVVGLADGTHRYPSMIEIPGQ
jgi:hypothetical protein